MTRRLIVATVLAALAARADGHPQCTRIDEPKKMLFLGNSFTYFNGGVPYHLLRLAKAADPSHADSYDYEMATISSASLYDLEVFLPRLKKQKWDVVVLQGQSREPIADAKSSAGFRASAQFLAKAVREAGAAPLLYMTWAFRDQPEMMRLLSTAYGAAGDELGALVVPVGLAFERARKEAPDIGLYYVDGFHPSLAGTYLAACVFHAAMFGRSPEGSGYVAAGLEPETAHRLQKIAWSAVREFYGREQDPLRAACH